MTGWRAYLGNAQHNYGHWTKLNLPEGKRDLASLEHIQGVLPFEVYARAPLRLISWCSFELPLPAKRLLQKLDVMCEDPNTSTEGLVAMIAKQQQEVQNEQEATRYLANLATMNIATRGKLPEYTTMVQEFLSTLPLPMTVYMLDYYLPMLSPNEGYNETGLTQQSAGPIRELMQEIRLMYLYKGSEFGHWRVTAGWDAFAFRHPSLGQTDVRQQLLPGATGVFREATTQERARRPSLVDPELLDGKAIDFRRSLIRLAYILQHAATLHPMAGDLQATLNSETSGISNIHSWGLMLPSSSRVSPVTYHAVVAVRYPSLCRSQRWVGVRQFRFWRYPYKATWLPNGTMGHQSQHYRPGGGGP